MNRIIKLLFLTAVLLAGASCTKDTIEEAGALPTVPEGYVRASLALNVAEKEQVNTRATPTEEEAYDDNNVWVLMFNTTSASDLTPTTIIQAPVKATKTGTQLYALLRATAQPVNIYVVTGLSSAMNTYMGTPSNFNVGTSTYADVSANAGLQTTAVTAAGVPIGGTNYIPMCTDAISYTTGTTTLTDITANFKRIVAKIDVNASAIATANFALEGITLINGAQKGFVLPQTTLPTNNGGVMQYTEQIGMASNSILSQVYLYENNGTTNPTKVIVKGKYKGGASSYYRMDLHKDISGVYTPYDIERNKHYTIVISEIQNDGYSTLAEAVANKPSNTKYTITVTDPDAYDVVSNGEYYIGVSNSEFVVYGDGELSNLLATTVTHNANSSTVTTNSISVSGGLTAVTTSLAAAANTADKRTDVRVTLPAGFTTASEGTITIKLGNLTKTIKVTRKVQLPAIGGIVSDFSSTDYVSGVVESAGMGDWLKLSANADGSSPTSAINKTVISPSGGVYIASPDHLPNSGGAIRSGSFFASRRTDQGRVRVVAYQGFINMGTAPINPLPYPYVGAFWRGDQTGERLIRMPVNANNLGAWSAVVMDGADWVVLDTQNSTDPNIGWKAGANESLVADMNIADASHQVSGSATSVNGTALADTDYIYFRIGLKSRLSVISAPRYARVGVTYNNNTKIQILYLRQGEEPDYLFRSTDGYGNSPGITGRPEAQKFSPYNLTDPNMGAGGADISNHNQLNLRSASAGENRFTAYPSQAGAFFQWAGTTGQERRAYHPTNPTGAITNWTNSYPATYWNTLDATHETCPQGYRRPNDGVTDSKNTAGLVAGSEFRQSLYLKPNAGDDGYLTSANTLWGYYADGFFDRRQIQNGLGASLGSNSAVSNNTKDVAYVGRLFFNPSNNASIFFSAAGFRSGELYFAGRTGNYWSSSASNTDQGWNMYLFSTGVYHSPFYRNYGSSVRCVVAPYYTVTFNANGGGGIVPAAMHVNQGSSITLPEQGSMSPPLHNVLVGWSLTPNGALVGSSGAAYTPIANTTLYAVWATSTFLRITRGTGSDGRPMLVLTDNPNDLGLYFKWGSLVGIYGGVNNDTYDAGDVAYDPRTDTPNIILWTDVPYADGTNFPTTLPPQSVANKNGGLGDPCRLVGLTKTQIEAGTVDNGTYRLPTYSEHGTLIAGGSSLYTPTGVFLGRKFTSLGLANNWYPAAGYRGSSDGTLTNAGSNGYYWSSSANSTSTGWSLYFGSTSVNQTTNLRYYGFTVRCVLQ